MDTNDNYNRYSIRNTKANDIPSESIEVPEWAYDYIIQYIGDGDLNSWNEHSICVKLESDSSLSESQKHYVAVILGDISAVKEFALDMIDGTTKGNEDDCKALYYGKVKRSIVTNVSIGAAGGGAVGGLWGVGLGIAGGLIQSIREITEYGYEYIRCTT